MLLVWMGGVVASILIVVVFLVVSSNAPGTSPGTTNTTYAWYDPPVGSDLNTWPLVERRRWGNPYAAPAPGQRVVDGGIEVPLGELPVVNPPASRRGFPYFQDPKWQEGGTEVNDYYKTHCKHLVLARGRLHYQGPHKACNECGSTAGGYVWQVQSPKSSYSGGQPSRSLDNVRVMEGDIRTPLLTGRELDPWWRRGPMSGTTLKVLKQYCKPGVTANPRYRDPTELE